MHGQVRGPACGGHMSPPLQDDEYVVYRPEQVRLKYVVRFSMEGDQLKEFSPALSTSAEPLPPPAVQGERRTPPQRHHRRHGEAVP